MRRRLLLSRSPGETRAALVAGDRLIDYEVHRDHAPSRLGGVYRGRIRKVIDRGRLAFVDVGDAEVLADLDATSAAAAGRNVAEGATVALQITQDARRGRLCRGTTRLAIVGPRLVFQPFGDADGISHRIADPTVRKAVSRRLAALDRGRGGLVARERAADAPAEVLNAELRALAAEWRACAAALSSGREPGPATAPPAPGVAMLRDSGVSGIDDIACDDGGTAGLLDNYRKTYEPDAPPPALVPVRDMDAAFDDLDPQLEAALSRRVALDGGGSITIERTEGMTAVDVDAGAAFETAAARGAQALNRGAAAQTARQLRLRAIGGLVVVDLVGAPRGKQGAAVVMAAREALAADPARTKVDHIERPGVILVSRQWSRTPLAEIVADVPPVDDGPAPESRDTIVLRAVRSARRAASSAPSAQLVVHLSSTAAAHWDAPHLAPAIAALGAALGSIPAVAAHADWPAERVEIATG